jgi:hypothetical protein
LQTRSHAIHDGRAHGSRQVRHRSLIRCDDLLPSVALAVVLAPGLHGSAQAMADSQLPDTPQPVSHSRPSTIPQLPCQISYAGLAVGRAFALSAAGAAGYSLSEVERNTRRLRLQECPSPPMNWYVRFTNGPQVKPLTPGEKAWLALRNVVDPFNAMTILGQSGISIGSDSHSPFGPGMPGFARNVGVSFSQDVTGEFFNTFVVPSIFHQDPHYHRMPHASIPRRTGHAILQVLWTQGDNGKPMLNYANLIGSAIDDEIGNLYIPGRQTNLPASAERYGIGLASAPIDNFVSEFLPDVASHIHVQVVVVQRIINQVAKTGPSD